MIWLVVALENFQRRSFLARSAQVGQGWPSLKMFKVDSQGTVAVFATVSAKGLGHPCFKDDRFYVTAYENLRARRVLQ